MIARTLACLALWALALSAVAPGAAVAADGLHLVLTPSQKPTDLLATGDEFAKVLTKLSGIPVRVTVASDYAAVIEALRNHTADLAFVHPVGYVLASREAKATIVVRNLWHGKSSFTSRIYVRKESGIKSARGSARQDDGVHRSGQLVGVHLSDGALDPARPREGPRPEDLLP